MFYPQPSLFWRSGDDEFCILEMCCSLTTSEIYYIYMDVIFDTLIICILVCILSGYQQFYIIWNMVYIRRIQK